MGKMAMGVVIGASLSGSFGATLGSASRKVAALGATVKQFATERGLIERFEKDQAALEKTRGQVGQTRAELLKLKAALRADPKDAGAAKALEAVEARAAKLGATLDRQKASLRSSEAAMVRAGATVGTFRDRYVKLGEAMEAAERKRAKMQRALQAKDAAAGELASMRGAALPVIGAAYGALRLGERAASYEHELRLFGNVADLSNEKLAAIRTTLDAVAKDTNQEPGALLEGLQDLTAKGMDVGTAVSKLQTLGKAATGTSAEMKDLASTVFSMDQTFNFSDAVKGMDMLAKAGDLGKFELKDMAKHFPALTAGAKSLGLQGREGIATLGAMLQIAARGTASSDEAANNFQNFIAKVTAPETVKRFKEHGVNLETVMKKALAAGKNPLEEMLALIQRLSGGDKFRVGELFGDMQVINFLNPMMQSMADYRNFKGQILSASGGVDTKFVTMMQTSQEQMKALKIEAGKLATSLGATLLPSINAVVGPLATAAGWIGKLVQEVPGLGAAITGLGVGIAAYQMWVVGAAAKTWLWNAAMAANPIGLVIAGVGALIGAGVYLWKNWDTVKEKLGGVWDWMVAKFRQVVGLIGRAWEYSPLGLLWKGAKWVGGALGGTALAAGAAVAGAPANAVRAPSAALGSALTAPRASLPQFPQAAVTSHSTLHAPITIHAAPGMDERRLAAEVGRQLDQRAERARARSRGRMHD